MACMYVTLQNGVVLRRMRQSLQEDHIYCELSEFSPSKCDDDMMDFVSMKPNCNFLLFIYLFIYFFIITVANIFANTISAIIGAGYHDLFSI